MSLPSLSFPAFQILLAAVLVLAIAVPTALGWRFLSRRGRHGWKALLLVIPGVNLAAVYAMAFGRRVAPGPVPTKPMSGALPNH